MTDPFPRHGRRVEAVLIGGSAGAHEMLGCLLETLPEELETPIVIVLHLQRHAPSLLPNSLRRKTHRLVREPQDKEPLELGTVYVAGPDYHLMIAAGPAFALSVEEPVNFSIPSIDVLFESAADALGPRVAAVLLSGASADGAQGLRAIAEAGGTVTVQAPSEAQNPTMPEAGLQLFPSAGILTASGAGRYWRGILAARSAARDTR